MLLIYIINRYKYIIKQQQSRMVDTNYFPQYNRNIIMQKDRLYLNSEKCNYSLQISLTNQQCSKVQKVKPHESKAVKSIVAIYGIIQMEVNAYLVVVTKSVVVGQIFRKKIFQVQKLQFICLSQHENPFDHIYINGVKQVLDNGSLYFSDQYDLTLSLQKYIESKRSLDSTRDQYMLNGEWVKDLKRVNAVEWITPFISGFITISFAKLNNQKSCQMSLISRRDKRRPGIRYVNRGCDLEGHPANACQTELILFVEQGEKQQYFSYVLFRGSLPFLWKQDPDLRGKPKITINEDKKLNQQIIKKHYQYIISSYGKCTSISLVDKKGYECGLGKYFHELHDNMKLPNTQFVWFDFHDLTKKQKIGYIAMLLDIVDEKTIEYGYFHLKHEQNEQLNHYTESKRQTGVFRINCMDCLDRTNVVQSIIARKQLVRWLERLKIVEVSDQIVTIPKLPPSLQQLYRDQWTQNANAISKLYSGTDAMKSDFTSKGKRTLRGILKDGRVGVQRYFLDNFYSSRQLDFINFSLGKLRPSQNESQKIRHSSLNSVYILGAMVISIPLLISISVNQCTQQEAPRTAIKVGLTAVGLLVFTKGAQLFESLIVRKPMRAD